MFPKSLVVLCVTLLFLCGAAGTLVAAAAIVEYLSTATRASSLLLGAVGAFAFGIGAIITATLCARFAFVVVWRR